MTMKQNKFAISLTIGGKTYESSGETMLEALTALTRPAKIMAKGVLKLMNGDLKKELLLTPLRVKQLFFTSRGAKEVKAKQLEAGMK